MQQRCHHAARERPRFSGSALVATTICERRPRASRADRLSTHSPRMPRVCDSAPVRALGMQSMLSCAPHRGYLSGLTACRERRIPRSAVGHVVVGCVRRLAVLVRYRQWVWRPASVRVFTPTSSASAILVRRVGNARLLGRMRRLLWHAIDGRVHVAGALYVFAPSAWPTCRNDYFGYAVA